MNELSQGIQTSLGGAYRLERELGGGGMSRVFVAEDVALGRRVVVKVLAPELAAGLNAERFRREIAVAAQLQHPHIVPVLAAGTAESLPYFVMPYVAGQSLRTRLDEQGALPAEEAAGILRDVAKALAFAHANGVSHRDIKPENVLLAGDSAVVTDFGIAKAIAAAAGRDSADRADIADVHTLTLAGTSLGTPAYMAPEQAAGDPDADHRADIYSLGVVAYELLAGRHPFHDRPPHGMMRAHIAETPAPLEDVAPTVPPALADLVTRCLAKDPKDRPQDAEEVVRALSPQQGSGERTSVWQLRGRKRRRFATVGAVTAGLIAILAGLAVTQGWLESDRVPLDDGLVAVPPFRVATADPSMHYLREGMLDLLAAKLTGQGGMRATEPRQMLDAWRRAGGSERIDLTTENALRLASTLHAGRLLLGDVVGSSKQITISAVVLDVPGGDEIVRESATGAPDDLAGLVDRLAAQLLASTSEEGEQRESQLAGISLPALRAYLDGQVKLRRGDAVAAAQDFTRALDADSSFALAGLGLHMATSWYGDPQLGARGIQIAWRERAKLSPRDRAMLEAVVGPRFPQPSTTREIYNLRERFLNLAPDRAEAWYLLGDHLFHFGLALGIGDARERALANFKKAMEIDSTYVVGYRHLMPLAVSLGDTATANKAVRLRLAADTAAWWHREHVWDAAHRANDRVTLDAIWDSLATDPQPGVFLNGVVSHAFYDGTGGSDLPRTIQQLLRTANTEAARRGLHRFAHDMSLVIGRPAEALRHLESSADSARDVNLPILKVRDAMLGDGDTVAAITAARELEVIDSRPLAADSAGRITQRAAARVLEPWRISRGDTTHSRRTLERLRAIARRDTALSAQQEIHLEIAVIEAMLAESSKSSASERALVRVDSILESLDYAAAHTGRLTLAALVSARLHEAKGDYAGALRSVRRRSEWQGIGSPYLPLQLREEGRLAVLAGDREGAIRAYQHFLRLRSDPEPRLRPQTDAVRRELARLESASR
jgi:eukaryotic-like serine/threonine-protein kinase